ncbi:High-affinity glucose transporter [Paramyrothecium foliicola]|nr:High-affinity glucose transporter [Paramyrothecium foliicola]
MVRLIVIGIALVVAMGGFVYGFDSGIIATTLGHDSFKAYFYGPSLVNTSLSGAIVSVYNAGQAIGGLTSGFVADKFSRKYAMSIMAFLSIVGAVLQCAAVHSAMMIIGRLIAGVGCGSLLSIVPIYLAETAQPSNRGFLVGLHGMMIAVGFGLANWVGYAGSYAASHAQWRIPLAMQIPVPAAMMVGCVLIPFSPLVQNDRIEEAKKVLDTLHGTDNGDLSAQELVQIREQLTLERSQGQASWTYALRQMFSKQYARRTLTAAFIVTMGQLSGSSVIQNFQNIFYQTVGFTGQTSLLISGIYGMMGIIGQIIYLVFVADRWPRVTTLWTGSVVLSVMISICMALSAQFGDADAGNPAGARGAIAMIFLYSACYAIFFNAMIWVVPSELFPFFLRSKGLAFAVFTKSVVGIVLSQVTPIALANVSWRYYSLFIATNMSAAVFYFFCLPETSGKSLEEIAELFGDCLATEQLGTINADKAAAMHDEYGEEAAPQTGHKAKPAV